MLKQLIYMSTASHAMSDAELEAILEVSVRNNQKLGVTGLLIVKDRTFMQALEGEAGTVDALYQRIAADQRHKGIIFISEETIPQREFSSWHMGYRNLAKLPPFSSPRLLDFARMDVTSPAFTQNPALVHELFQEFIENN